MSREEVIMSFPERDIDSITFIVLSLFVVLILMVICSTIGYFAGQQKGAVAGGAIVAFMGLIITPICIVFMDTKHAKEILDWESEYYYEYVDTLSPTLYGVQNYDKSGDKYAIRLTVSSPSKEVVTDSVVYDAKGAKGYVEAKYAKKSFKPVTSRKI